jgi:hypothetical protein
MNRLMIGVLIGMVVAAASAQEPRSLHQRASLMRDLYAGISAACTCAPSISVDQWSKWPDVSGWAIQWPAGTTAAQQAAGQDFIAKFNPSQAAK